MHKDVIERQLNIGLINTNTLLSGVKLIDESLKITPEYLDNNHFPFYYHYGKQVSPKKICQIGPKLGLVGCCFLRSCKTVTQWDIFDFSGIQNLVT